MMSVLLVFILSIRFFTYAQTGQSGGGLPCIFCSFDGTNTKNGYKFSVADLPERCEAVSYGKHFFNAAPSPEDTAAIAALVAAKKIVFTFYSPFDSKGWTGVMNADDESPLDKEIGPMIQYLNKNKLNGVILSYLDLFAGEVKNYETKIKSLICKIRAGVPSIKIGILLAGHLSRLFGNKDLFDFNAVNADVDMYLIDMSSAGNNCTANTQKEGGYFPIRSSNKDVVSLENVKQAAANSAMDHGKMYILLPDFTVTISGDELMTKTFGDYCQRKQGGSDIWCADTTQLFYDSAKFVKGTFKGIMIADLDLDDYSNACGCKKFPVANTYIDGWQGKPITCCEKI